MGSRMKDGGPPHAGNCVPREQVPETPNLTDRGNAIRFVRDHGGDVLHSWPWRKWLIWDGRRWKVDDTGEPHRRVKETVRDLYRWAVNELTALGEQPATDDDDDDEAKERSRKIKALNKVLGHCLKSEAAPRLNAVLDIARSERGIPVLPDQLDAHPWLLNVANGTLDLSTGELRDHCREDMLTKICPTGYRPGAECPEWERFLAGVFSAGAGLISWVQRLLGYALTGEVREHVLPIFWGGGANGKSTLLNAVQDVLGGDYAMKAAPDLLTAKKGAHPTERADLFGMRLVVGIETEAGASFAEAMVKELTGGDRVRARRMREDFWEFAPTHKIILCTNHKPKVAGDDFAIWRRLKLVPFAVTFAEADQDKQLPNKLRAEAEGILAWLVRGCRAWQREGLGMSPEVAKATEQYRGEQNTFGEFIDERCVVSTDPAYKVRSGDLYSSYVKWCERASERPVDRTDFGERVAKLPGVERYTSNGTCYRGIALRDSGEDEI
jgi:putative DNA primase/helicase